MQTEQETAAPLLSVVVLAHDMPEQLANTLTTLGPSYQRHIRAADYEVIVVENRSPRTLPADTVAGLPDNFRYHLRDEEGVSPVPALEFALRHCRAPYLGLILDGAQMLSPGVLHLALEVLQREPSALVAVPGYHLGEEPQHQIHDPAALIERQSEFLATEPWTGNGYRLFRDACFSPGNKKGFLQPLMEANALFCLLEDFQRLGCADPRFDLPGGGSLNLHIYRTLGLRAATRPWILPGEGTFHQYHGGVTTSPAEDISRRLAQFDRQLKDIWHGAFHGLRREPVLFGPVGRHAEPFLQKSLHSARRRFRHLRVEQRPQWEDEPAATAVSAAGNDEASPPRPRISIVCVVYNIPRQFANTLHTLTPLWQEGGEDLDYEVVVVENPSENVLPRELIERFPGKLKYHLNEQPSVSPAAALNQAVDMADGEVVGLLIDSAYMLSPGILSQAAWLFSRAPGSLLSVPGYHLGGERQEFSSRKGYDERTEIDLLESADWQRRPYNLFNIACLSGANPHGILHPAMESHLLFCSKAAFHAAGGANTEFRSPGGGSVNMDLYRELVSDETAPLHLLWGEGVFHQYHGGVTTSHREDLPEDLQNFQQEFRQIRGSDYQAVRREPVMLGPLRERVMPFIEYSCRQGRKRFRRFAGEGRDPWIDDGGYNR